MTSSPPPPPEQQPQPFQDPSQAPRPFFTHPPSSGPIMPGWAWALVVVFGAVLPAVAGIVFFVIGWNSGY
ncbi:hypothetical protein [Aeromicrobium alkaliterrae]|uniref:Uncharacterized protein n=1 Tax=Aeromicrobium alkaliterrae TaxID=302168 RepID=A0ABN2JVG2_9ACTN